MTKSTTSALRWGVAGRATVLILLIVCACFAACAAYIYRAQSEQIRADISASMTKLSVTSARGIGNWLRGKVDLTQLMAQQVAVVGASPVADSVLGAPIARETFLLSSFGGTDGFYTKMPKGSIAAGYDARKRP
jgi:methyl-accepting chemotaxis protein